MTTFLKDVPVKLTDLEMVQRGQELSALVIEHVNLEDTKKLAQQLGWGVGALTHTQDSCDVFFRIMRRMWEMTPKNARVPMKSLQELDQQLVTVHETVRQDTGDVVESRPMTHEEIEQANQGKLFALADSEERKGRKTPGSNN